jgi:hypothetical protein
MSVVNGQIADQNTFNTAFMSRTAPNTSTIAKVGLLDPDQPESGLPINNAQKAINKAFEGVGATGENDATINDYANQNYIQNGDNRKVAVEKLDAQLAQTQSEIDAAEVILADHENRITQNEDDIENHEIRIGALENDVADLEQRVNDIESNDMTIGGNKTFSGDIVIQGDLEVQGETTFVNSENLQVTDQNILVNKNGTDMSAEGAGIDVERPLGDAGIHFDSSLASFWKIGLLSDLKEIIVSGVAQVISGAKDFVSGIKVDTIIESTSNEGVTVESVLLKDGLVDGRNIATDGTTLDGHALILTDHENRITTLENDVADIEQDVADLQNDFAGHETRIVSLESGNMVIDGNKTFNGNTEMNNVNLFGSVSFGADENAQTGANAQIVGFTASLIRLTGALSSIDGIDSQSINRVLCLLNVSGSSITINNETGTPNENRIKTGTGANVTLANNQFAVVVYDIVSARWYLSSVGGGGGGGGGSGKKTFDMKLNGLYGGSGAYNNVDGLWIAPTNIQITNVFIYQDQAGSGGTTTLDLKVKPFLSGSFTSIFLTTPKVTNGAGSNVWCGVGDSVGGFTAPILTSLPFAVAAKSALRMDLLGAQSGNAAGVGLIIEYEEI